MKRKFRRRTLPGEIKQSGTMEDEVTEYPERYVPYGGMMPFFPKDCPCATFARRDKESGILWLSNQFCVNNYCKNAPCNRRKEYVKSKEWYKESDRLTKLRREGMEES